MVPELSNLLLFCAAAFVLAVTPGPAVIYIVARSIDQGRLAGFVSSLGMGVGTLFHIAAAAFGVSAILMSSVLTFQVVKYLGAAYLIYLGIRKLRERDEPEASQAAQVPRGLRSVFRQAILVNLLNPKTALFFFAFLPQFVSVGRGSVTIQIVFLGFVFIVLTTVTDTVWAVVAGSVADWVRGNLRYLRYQRLATGSVYIALGVGTALSGQGRK